MIMSVHRRCSSWISVIVLSFLLQVLSADDVTTTSSDDFLTSGCSAHCTCYFSTSPVSTVPLRTVNCSDVIFASTKFHISRQTESLIVSGSQVDLPILTAVLFRDGNQLRELVLSRGHLHSFDGLAAPETLQSVVASHNELVSLPDATFVRFASLTLLDLSNNRLEVIHRYAFVGLKQLRQLDLSHNHLSGAFEGFRWVCELRHLEVLNLSHNGIHVLDDSTFACSQQSSVPLPRRWFKPDESDSTGFNASFRHLLVLDLGFNRIRHIHSGAFVGLGNIDEILLNDNSLLGLPVHLVALTPDVKVWDLSGNEVDGLNPGSFRNNQWLQELRLNRVHRLRIVDDAAFVNLSSLRRLELSHNRNLRYISRSAFVDLPALASLDVTDSGLDTLELQVIDSLPALRQLSVTGNPLTCDCTLLRFFQHIQDNVHLNTDLYQHAACSNDSTTLASYRPSQNSTTFNSNLYTNIQSIVTTESQLRWHSTTNDVVPNSTGTHFEVQESMTASSRCSPRILALFDREIHVVVPDILRIDCRAVGDPLPTVSWLLPVGVIDDVKTDNGNMSMSHGTQVIINNGTLLINAVAMRHRGNYTCLADDGGNPSDHRSVYIHVKPSGTSLMMLHVTSSAVTITWRGLHTSREYRVRYSEKRRDLNATTAAGEILLKPYMRSFTASHLKPHTKYLFCIDVRQATFVSRYHVAHRGHFVAVYCTDITTRHERYGQPLVRSLAVHFLTGATAAVASLGVVVATATFITRRYDRRKLRQAALHSASVSSGGILLQRDDDLTAAVGTGSATSFAASAAASVTFENRAAVTGVTGDIDDCDCVAMFDSYDLDEIRTTAIMQRL